MSAERTRLPEWFIVARREFLERVRSKWFVIITLLGPVGMAALIIVPAWLSIKSAEKGLRIDVIDRSGRDIGSKLEGYAKMVGKDRFVVRNVGQSVGEGELLKRIKKREIDGYLEIPKNVLAPEGWKPTDGKPFEAGAIIYRGSNATNMGVVGRIKDFVRFVVRQTRARDAGIADVQFALLMSPVPFDSMHSTGTKKGTSGKASYIIGTIVMIVLYMAIVFYAVNVMRSVVQEKTSRVVEIMVSAVKPSSLMWGKIFGVGCVGLFQLGIWALMAALLLGFREQILGAFGAGAAAAAFSIPSIPIAAFFFILAYFLLGYFFYAAMYAAVGAMVNSEQEAQQLQTPVIILLVIPLLCFQLVADDPRGGIAEVLTMIPFSSPVLMPMRYLMGGTETVGVLMSLLILAASMAAVVWLAARIYRVGILMYGKRPGLREIIRWIKYT